MATETPASHQTPVSDEPIETKVNEVKPAELETVSQVEESEEEEKPNTKELPSQSNHSQNLVVDADGEQTEPPTVVDKKIDDVPTSEPASDSANSQTTAEPPLTTSEPVEAAVEKVEEEKPKVVDAPQSSDEAIAKPHEPPIPLPIKESEATVQNDYDNTVIAKEVDGPEPVVPGVQEHAQEQSEVTNKTAKIDPEQLFGEAKDPSATVSLKSEEVPEVEVKQEEEAKFEEPEDRSSEATEKVHDPAVVFAADEPKSVIAEDTDDTVVQPKQIETPQLVAPEAEVKHEEEPKLEKPGEQPLEATDVVEDPLVVLASNESKAGAVQNINDTVALAEVKEEEELKFEKTEEPSSETPQHVVPEAEVKQEEETKFEKPGGQPLEATEEVDTPAVFITSNESKAAAVQNTDRTVAEAEVKQEEELKFDKPEEPSFEATEKQVENPQLVIPEAKVKQEEETKFEKPEEQPFEATEKVQDPVAVLAFDEAKAADTNDTVSQTKQVEAPKLVIPEDEVQQEEEPKFEKPEKQSFEATGKVPDPVVVLETIESTAALPDTDDTVAPTKQLETLQLVVPEAEVKLGEQAQKLEREILQPEVKSEEHSLIAKEVGEPESEIPEVQVKPEEQSGIVEQVKTKLNDENQEPIKVTEAIDQGTERETVKEVPILVSTVAETGSANVEKIDTEEKKGASMNSEQAVSTVQEDQADSKQVQGNIADMAVAEDAKKQIDVSDVVEVSSKEATEEKGNAGEEQEPKFSETKENLEKYTPKEEVAHPIKAEGIQDSISNVEVTERSLEVAKSVAVEPTVEDKTEGKEKEETRASVETNKKLDEATSEVTETTRETQDLVSGVKTIESATSIENEEKKEKAEEMAQSDVQNNKDGDESKGTQEQAREAPVKPTQKQSNNIFTKVKQSLVKAKKAITGRSPNPKTVSSDTKDDIKVK